MEKVKLDKIDKLFRAGMDENIFSSASFGFSQWNGKTYSRTEKSYGEGKYYDLASLTKVLSTVPLFLIMAENRLISVKTRLKDVFPDIPQDKKDIEMWHLLSHCSGLPSHKEYFHEARKLDESLRKDYIFSEIIGEPLISRPGLNHVYSDLGYILLGFIIEKISGHDLGYLIKNEFYSFLGIENEIFYGSGRNVEFVQTGYCPWSGEKLVGKVNDDNCRAMGGVCGHAGLFGTVRGVISLCELFMSKWKGVDKEQKFFTNESLRNILKQVGLSGWTMGFDMVSENGSSSGDYFSGNSVGHLGYTGTSLWMDPASTCIAVLLTNRTFTCRNADKIKKFRPFFHNLLLGPS